MEGRVIHTAVLQEDHIHMRDKKSHITLRVFTKMSSPSMDLKYYKPYII